MKKCQQEDIIKRKILDFSYDSQSLVLGNISPFEMANTEKIVMNGIGQNIAIINLLNRDMANVDRSNNEEIIFEYFWGFVYQYICSNPNLKQKYIDVNIEQKLMFFNSLLGKQLDESFLENKKNLFSQEPRKIIIARGECDFKICIFNYQEISSMKLAEYINLLTRERPQLTILTTEGGLKCNTTGGFYTSVGQDFDYYDIGSNGRNPFRLEKLKTFK